MDGSFTLTHASAGGLRPTHTETYPVQGHTQGSAPRSSGPGLPDSVSPHPCPSSVHSHPAAPRQPQDLPAYMDSPRGCSLLTAPDSPSFRPLLGCYLIRGPGEPHPPTLTESHFWASQLRGAVGGSSQAAEHSVMYRASQHHKEGSGAELQTAIAERGGLYRTGGREGSGGEGRGGEGADLRAPNAVTQLARAVCQDCVPICADHHGCQ